MDGFYATYLTGSAGTSLALLLIREGAVVGADVGGLKYDGTIEQKSDGTGYVCSVVYVIPAGATLITGAEPPNAPVKVPLAFELPLNFADGQVVGIVTPLGLVNARFEKIREL